MKKNYEKLREELVKEYISTKIKDERVIQAMLSVPRHEFVLKEYKDQSYFDTSLPIGEGQTISQPSLVARMTQQLKLKGSEKVLEVGTGSGYQAAILGKLAIKIYTIEFVKSLVERARKNLEKLNYKNISVIHGNGTLGLPSKAPFDAIVVSAGGKSIPKALVKQLKDGGRIVIPYGKTLWNQKLVMGVKKGNKLETKEITSVVFVPLVGVNG